MDDRRQPGLLIQGIWFLSPAEALQALQAGALLVDLRRDDLVAMKAFSVPDIIPMPHMLLPHHAGELPRDRLLILADSSGVYTKGAAAALAAAGFQQVACLNGGMLAWDQAGMPVDTDPDALLHGECGCVIQSRKERR